ncbi:hypothetical protein ACJ73_04437 [Blastomyces percursus]|uniref:Uncharacterized protein n=1 Tax=Blastomyces percursus TaxID=1658174 RepID=A0A1J9Q808_9EURO|nr:hypothetical protein ACJ73_04437 [Blastomyces percursus]
MTTPKTTRSESFLNSVQAYTKKSRASPSSHEILDKLNQIHHIAKTTISDDLTLIKNAVNHAATHPTARNPTWADRVRSGSTPPQPIMTETEPAIDHISQLHAGRFRSHCAEQNEPAQSDGGPGKRNENRKRGIHPEQRFADNDSLQNRGSATPCRPSPHRPRTDPTSK